MVLDIVQGQGAVYNFDKSKNFKLRHVSNTIDNKRFLNKILSGHLGLEYLSWDTHI